MATRSSGAGLRNQLNTLSKVGVVGDLTDGQILQRFLRASDGEAEVAFAALVERHGPMVRTVCRELAHDWHDADDAFQATFLILFRKAGAVRKADSVASWLHGVALRVGRQAMANAIKRKALERRAAEMRAIRDERVAEEPETWAELHEEIARLPARYREPLVLCYLEGLTTEAAARRLRCPQGTILSRLARGRERLRDRLIRRGSAPFTGLLTAIPGAGNAAARVPAALLDATTQMAARLLKAPADAGLVSPAVSALAKGALQGMFWAKLNMVAVAGLASIAVAACTSAALDYPDPQQNGPGGRAQQGTSAGATAAPAGKRPDAAKPGNSSTAFVVALPAPDELHALLLRVSGEAVAIAKAKPNPSSWCLTAVASAQAKSGDRDGARATFADAAREADGSFGAAADPWNLWRIGQSQAECGLSDDARTMLQRAVKALPGVVGDFDKDYWTVETFAAITQEQAKLAAREDARESTKLLQEFADQFFKSSEIGNARDTVAPKIAASLAAVGDFEAAFRWSEGVENAGNVLGEIAVAASRALDRTAARKFVREAAERLAKRNLADETYFGLSDLAEAQARLGDVAEAKRSAMAIGQGPSRGEYDMTDGQPFALIRIATVQREAGDTAGAQESLKAAFRCVGDHPNMRGRDGRYSQIAWFQITTGDIDGAVWTVAAMAENRSLTLASIARLQAARGDLGAARDTFARALSEAGLSVKNPAPPNEDLNKLPGVSQNMPASARMQLAEIQAMAGDVPGALKTVRSIDDHNYVRSAMESVASARATAGDVAGALRLCLEESQNPEERRAAIQGLAEGIDTRLSLKHLDRPAK